MPWSKVVLVLYLLIQLSAAESGSAVSGNGDEGGSVEDEVNQQQTVPLPPQGEWGGVQQMQERGEDGSGMTAEQSAYFADLAEDGRMFRHGEEDSGAWKAIFDLPPAEVLAGHGAGNLNASYALALKHLLGAPGVPRNPQLAVELLHRAADTGHAHAQSVLGSLHTFGHGVELSEARAFLYHQFAASGGSYQSMMAAGYSYMCQGQAENALTQYAAVAEKAMACFAVPGQAPLVETVRLSAGGEQSAEALRGHRGEDDETIQYVAYTAEQGNRASLRTLGNLYYWGARGVPRDHVKAFTYLRRAAEAGDPLAMVALGEMYARGVGVQEDHREAVRWFKTASELGQVASFNGLGYMYAHGRGVERNYTKAILHFTTAAKNGEPDGQYNLGVLHMNGLGIRRNPVKARDFFLLAAKDNHLGAVYQLAKMHHHGVGTPKNVVMAAALYKAVAERGPWGQILRWAHQLYMDGDLGPALLLYLRAADLGYEVAQHNAAWLLERGATSECLNSRGLRCTPGERHARAHLLWRLASEQGNVQAALLIGDAYFYGKGTKRDLERAAEAYRRAAQHRSAQALFNLGWMHEHGKGLPRDLHLAKRFYDEALEVDREAALPVRLALLLLWLRTQPKAARLVAALDTLPEVVPKVVRAIGQFVRDESNGTMVTLTTAFVTVLFLRRRARLGAQQRAAPGAQT